MRARPVCVSGTFQLQQIRPTYHVADDANRIACGQTRQPDGQASGHVHDAGEKRVVSVGRRPYVARDEDGDDEGIDGQDTRHDDGDQALRMSAGAAKARRTWLPS